ncbi:hypothetical protein [Gimesia panareensis]|uniref:Uncharacterized protein n=1 Tax=Gimesia panareensis TaxID=2527978 RepID=A0A517QBR7_9PLAN|nr:hypothetical protein [Gimesia panareensis]QDT29019.1 hypothetical protein Enr10x_43680 [Gimesia panareensis]QDU51871.1 hypothetical protein Pan110_42410 [Gimesia panareensis]
MNDYQYEPLKYPLVWPPPGYPAPSPESREAKFRRIPLLGWFPSWILRHIRWRKHYYEILEPIAEEIVEQLEARPQIADWSSISSGFATSRHQKIAEIISDAICLEKGLENPPPLHPEDPSSLLFWGPFDDLTPLIVGMEIHKEFNCHVPRDVLLLAWQQDWCLREFIDYCVQSMTQGTDTT